jgi:SAM-dependent methyltransferase
MKLNLGCGSKKMFGFTNVDIRSEVNPDVIDDCFELENFEMNSVDLIFTSHMLEHADRKEAMAALKRWYDILKHGGEIYIAVPDLEKVFSHYMFYKDLRYIQGFLYGGQKCDEDFHYTGYDEKTLKEDLTCAGFHSIERYNWQETEWSYIDSYEQAYFPHLQKNGGVLMSLNMKAVK